MLIRKKCSKRLFIAIAIILLSLSSFSFSFMPEDLHPAARRNSKVSYHVLLMGIKLRLPEIDNLVLADNGTFTLVSDSWDATVSGTYKKKAKLIEGSGRTGIFYDEDWNELMDISYAFKGYRAGLRGFFIIGSGSRKYEYTEDDSSASESIIFLGLSFR